MTQKLQRVNSPWGMNLHFRFKNCCITRYTNKLGIDKVAFFFSSNYFFFVRNSFTFYVKKFVKISFFVSKFAKTSMSSSNQYWWTKIHINKLLTNFFTVFDIFKEFFFCKICTPSKNELSSILHHWIQFSSLDWLANNQLIGNN